MERARDEGVNPIGPDGLLTGLTRFWLQVLTEVKNRGTQGVWIVVCDGLKGLPER